MSPAGVLQPSDVELIAGFEGFRPWIYDDAHPHRPYQRGTPVDGTLTIGYGETHPSVLERFKDGITKAEALELLGRRAQEFADAVMRSLTRTPTLHQFGAMTCLAYNIGTAGFAGSTVCRRFNKGDIAGAAEAFLLWQNGLQPGDLLPRRQAEVVYFLTPDSHSDQPKEIPEMMIISFNGRAYLLSGGMRVQIDRPEQIDQLKAAGIPEVKGSHTWASGFPEGFRPPGTRRVNPTR